MKSSIMTLDGIISSYSLLHSPHLLTIIYYGQKFNTTVDHGCGHTWVGVVEEALPQTIPTFSDDIDINNQLLINLFRVHTAVDHGCGHIWVRVVVKTLSQTILTSFRTP